MGKKSQTVWQDSKSNSDKPLGTEYEKESKEK